MKIRNGFVSNSSSSSFKIMVNALTKLQIKLIVNHVKHYCEFLNDKREEFIYNNAWEIAVDRTWVTGCTDMDNLDMKPYLRFIGVRDDVIQWDY